MISTFKKYFLYFIISFTLIIDNFSQIKTEANSFLHQNLIVSLESGLSYGFTDYSTSHLQPLIRGSIEYYPIIINNARIGLSVFGGGIRISQSDNRLSFASNDYPFLRQMPVDTYTDMIQLGGSVNLGYALGESLIPYIGVGGAYINFSPKNSNGKILEFNSKNIYNKNIFSFVVEGGVKFRITDRFSLNAAISYYPTNTDYLDDISSSKKNDSFLSGILGISYAFIGRSDSDGDGISDNDDLCPNTPEGVIVDEFGCPIDSDKDGVPDYLDKCPDTPNGVTIDKFGCPIDSDQDGVPDYLDKCPDTPTGMAVDANGCPPDEDGDGVPDYKDKCPNTPYGVAVDKLGCPLDSDKDGVPDYKDKCPGTPLNTKVDSNGCPIAVTQEDTFYQFVLRGDDTFINNSATLKDAAKLLLNEIAFYIQNQPDSKWRIEGHMDSQGSVSGIKKLSYDRAKSVFDYLVAQGLSPNRFVLYGLGDSFPIANNNTEEGRSTNRRIMIIRED